MFRHICCTFRRMGIYCHMSTIILPVDLGFLVSASGMNASLGWKLSTMKRRNFPCPCPQAAFICKGECLQIPVFLSAYAAASLFSGITSDIITSTASNGKHVVNISEVSNTAWVSWSGYVKSDDLYLWVLTILVTTGSKYSIISNPLSKISLWLCNPKGITLGLVGQITLILSTLVDNLDSLIVIYAPDLDLGWHT